MDNIMYNKILISTTFDLAGYDIIEYKGLVRGIVVRSPTIVQGILGGLKNFIGGKIGAYTEMCEQTRDQACQEIIKHAQEINANAIIGFKYDATDIGGGNSSATEVLCYGTAVVVKKR
jgi:uncharacterized protein YbjQ (UPF0145 family)